MFKESRELGVATWSGPDEDGFPNVSFDSHGEPGKEGSVAPFELHHTFGFYSRPRDPEVDDETKQPIPGQGCNLWAETHGEDTYGHLGHDPRFVPKIPAASKGSSVQYSATGSFFLLDGVDDDGTGTLYVPIPGTSKAHAFTFGKDGNGKHYVGLVQSEGLAITMLEKSLVIKNASGSAYIELNDAGIKLSGNIFANGGMVMGTSAAQPLVTLSGLANVVSAIMGTFQPLVGGAAASSASALPITGALLAAGTTLTKGT